MTVGEMMQRMSSTEYIDWMRYYRVEPFGPLQASIHAGIIASTIANVNRSKGARSFSPADFMQESQGKEKTQTVEEQMAVFQKVEAMKHGRSRSASHPGNSGLERAGKKPPNRTIEP